MIASYTPNPAVIMNKAPILPRCLHYQWHSFGFITAVGIMGLATPGRKSKHEGSCFIGSPLGG